MVNVPSPNSDSGRQPIGQELYDFQRVIDLASDALYAAVSARWKQAVMAVSKLESEYRDGTWAAMMVWCDTLIASIEPGHTPGQPVRLAMVNATQAGDGSINAIRHRETTLELIRAGKVRAARAEKRSGDLHGADGRAARGREGGRGTC